VEEESASAKFDLPHEAYLLFGNLVILTHSQEVPVFQSLNRESSRFGGWSRVYVTVEKAKPYALCLLTKVLSNQVSCQLVILSTPL